MIAAFCFSGALFYRSYLALTGERKRCRIVVSKLGWKYMSQNFQLTKMVTLDLQHYQEGDGG